MAPFDTAATQGIPGKRELFSMEGDRAARLAELRRLQGELVAGDLDDPRVQVSLANVTAAIRGLAEASR